MREDQLTEDELLERELKRIDAFEETKSRLLADAEMYLAQAQNRGLNCFECRILLNSRGFPIQLLFSAEIEAKGEKKTKRAVFVIDKYMEAYTSRDIALTLNDAVDLKIAVQSMICNTTGIISTSNPLSSGQRAVELDTQMPLPVNNYKIVRRSNGMYSLIFEARDPYTRKIINPSIPLGMSARHENEKSEKQELEDRTQYVVDYLHEVGNHRTTEGHRVFVTKRDVLTKLQAHLEERGGEWVTIEQKKLSDLIPEAATFDTDTLIHVSLNGHQKITLAPPALRMDFGGDNPSWQCWLPFYIGDKNKKFKGENVRTRTLNLHTQNPALAAARAFESLVGVKSKSGDVIVEGFLPKLQRDMRLTGHEWRLENKGTPQEEVFIGDQPLQFFFDDMMRYERDIGIMLDKREFGADGNVRITIQALRSLTGDYSKKVKFTPERIHESRNNELKLVAYTLTVPSHKSDRIEEFVQAVHKHIRWHADEAYSSIALGTGEQEDMRKKPLTFRTSQIRLSVLRAVEELYQEYFDSRLPRYWYRAEMQMAFSSEPPKPEKAHHLELRPTLLDHTNQFARHRSHRPNYILG